MVSEPWRWWREEISLQPSEGVWLRQVLVFGLPWHGEIGRTRVNLLSTLGKIKMKTYPCLPGNRSVPNHAVDDVLLGQSQKAHRSPGRGGSREVDASQQAG